MRDELLKTYIKKGKYGKIILNPKISTKTAIQRGVN
jgi:hypothetical protein